jgi:hypothetical protein
MKDRFSPKINELLDKKARKAFVKDTKLVY